MAAAVMSTAQRQKFKEAQEVDLAYSVPGLGRFRCNVFQQRGTIGLVLRVIPMQHHRRSTSWACRRCSRRIAEEERGLVLVTGTTGSGKSTTLAAMVDHINTHAVRPRHDRRGPDRVPAPRQPLDRQPARGRDRHAVVRATRCAARCARTPTSSWSARCATSRPSRRRCWRPRPATWSSRRCTRWTPPRPSTASSPCSRRTSRSRSACSWPRVLKAVISQRLVPRADGNGRVPAVEVMISTPFIRDCIVDKEKTHLIQGAIAAGTSQYGMQTFDQSIFGLYAAGPGHLRRGPALGDQRRRVQAEGPGHRHRGRRGARPDGERRPRRHRADRHHPLRPLAGHPWRARFRNSTSSPTKPGRPPTRPGCACSPGARCPRLACASAFTGAAFHPTPSTMPSRVSRGQAHSTTAGPFGRLRARWSPSSCAAGTGSPVNSNGWALPPHWSKRRLPRSWGTPMSAPPSRASSPRASTAERASPTRGVSAPVCRAPAARVSRVAHPRIAAPLLGCPRGAGRGRSGRVGIRQRIPWASCYERCSPLALVPAMWPRSAAARYDLTKRRPL